MKKIITLIAFVGAGMLVAPLQANPDAVVGSYVTQGGKSIVAIYKCGAKYCGRIVWLKEPNKPDGTPKVDTENPNPAKRTRPIKGMNLVWGFKHDGGNEWSGGNIYNPENGKTYYCKMTLNGKKLKVRGSLSSMGLLGKTVYWTKTK